MTKFVGCGLGALRLGRADAARVSTGMIPRGEVGMVVAQIGLGLRIIPKDLYAIVVLMSIATIILAPPLLKRSQRGLIRPQTAGDDTARPPSSESPSPRWSRDARSILLVLDTKGGHRLAKLRLPGKVLVGLPRAESPALSPDGTRIVYDTSYLGGGSPAQSPLLVVEMDGKPVAHLGRGARWLPVAARLG